VRLEAVEAVNDAQKEHVFALMQRHYGPEGLAGKRIALWGLAFKPNTDDMREAPSLRLVARLLEAGAEVVAHDPEAMDEARRRLGDVAGVQYAATPAAALAGADALVLMTEWKAYWSPDFGALAGALRDRVVFDGRNVWFPDAVEDAGIAYYGIGRGRSVARPAS
jgi:UDPglucose 6-dehydrogenase